MRKSLVWYSFATLFVSSIASAKTLYVSPTGTEDDDCSSRRNACSLGAGAYTAAAGDTVVLMDGIYQEPLYVANSGTSDAWITFEADECATPIIEGEGAGPNDDVQSSGVGSSEGEYLRFRGIVSRGWNIGFGNAWAGGTESDEVSNGHWEIENCISYSNGRTGFTFFSAEGFKLRHSISAHNGSSAVHSWSSGVTLFEAEGTDNLVEGTISFENTDAERHTDGSGFIVDEESNNATFINNIAFGNGGSCLRLTKSSGTRFVNNTCYHNSQFGGQATGPNNPGELYFTNSGVTIQGVTFVNNIIAGTGQSPAGPQPVVNQPQSGWMNNLVTTGDVSFFTDAGGMNPNFVPAMGASEVIGAGSAGGNAPADDIGFDPKCLVKRTPVMVGAVAAESWWQFDIDIDYIKSIGGVAACFNPATRTGNPDLGAYSTATVTTVEPGSCIPPVIEPEPVDVGAPDVGAGGDNGAAGGANPMGPGVSGSGGATAVGAGGAGNDPGPGNPAPTGTANPVAPPAGDVGTGMANPGPFGTVPGVGATASATPTGAQPGASNPGVAPSASGSAPPSTVSSDATSGGNSGCDCSLPPTSNGHAWLALLAFMPLVLRRRRYH